MAPNYFQKPEAALKRAQELIQVGKEADALETLHDTIKAKRHKQWTSVHEQIMMKHMELCVELKKHHVAKDALFQYKALTQQINVKSLETVVEHFLKLAEQKTEEAQKASIEKVEEIGDLDQGDVPETMLLAVVSGAVAQDRMDRTVLAPWLRFLWDSYRNCLELLRNNAQVEHLYHQISRHSFSFCAKYQRRTEFRKLCDILRMHLNQIQKHQHMAHVVKLNSPESLAMMQETRLCQLDTAIQMELWQEAYKSAEDVHGMMQLSKDKDRKTVKPASYVNYYDKLALVFWKAGNSLFHAAALLQKYIIYKDMKKQFTIEEAQEQATRVLLATLAIPDGADAPSDLTRNLDIEEQHIANMRLLSNLLRLPIAPTKAGILKEAARIGVPEVASDNAKELYKLLENNFAPLRVAKDVQKLLQSVERQDYLQYVDALQSVVSVKALKQISVIYDSISWDRIRKVIPFYNDLELERLVVEASKHSIVRAQVDHRADCVRFGAADATLAGGVDLEDADGFTGDDTQLGVEGIRNHLEVMYNKLRKVAEALDGDKRRKELIARVESHALNYEKNRPQEVERIQQRKKKLENYKEKVESVKAEKALAAQTEAAKREEAMRAEEMKRLDEQNKESEKKRKQAETDEIQRKIKQDQLRKMQQNVIYQAIIKEKGLENFQDMDPEVVLREQRERLDKERMETQRRLQQQEKNFDHHIRALHLEEMQERKAVMYHRLTEAPRLHEEYEEKRIAKEIEEHEKAVKTWSLWEQAQKQAFDWIDQVKNNNGDVFDQKVIDWETKLDAVRNSRLADRAEQRKKERKEERQKEKAEEERKRREDEERARQALFEEQRRARDKDRDNRRGGRDMEDSVAMADSNWRSGGGATTRAPMRPREDRPMRDGPMRDGPRGGDRPPLRERENIPSTNADRDNSWRSGMAAVVVPTTRPERNDDRPARRSDPKDDGFMRREPTRPSAADGGGTWTRGQISKKDPPATSSQEAAPAEKPVATGPAKFVPSRLRQNQDGPAAAAAPPASSGPRDFGSLRSGPPDARDGPNKDGPRTANPPPPAREIKRAPAPGGAGAEKDMNWRRN